MSDIVKVIQESGVEKPTAESLQKSFLPFFEKAQEWKEKAGTIKVTSVDQVDQMKLARTARLELKNIRVAADKTRQALKEDSLRYGRAVQGVYNVIEYLITPIEKYLEDQEKFAEREEAKRKAELTETRNAEIAREGVQVYLPYNLDLGGMPEEDYQKLIAGARMLVAAKLEAERKAEQERIERAKAEAEERERVRRENERLKAEADEREEAIQKERAELAAKVEFERIEREKIQAEERAKADAERKALEEKAATERRERERIEAEMKAKAEKEATELKAKAEAERKAKSAPDREKLIAFAESLNALVYPTTTTDEAGSLINRVREAIGKIAVSLSSEANKL